MSERLTLQELTWLLTQEARTAAEKLRKGVAILAAPDPGATITSAASVEPELDALDDAMKTLASLHTGSSARGRRGRIDLATLLWEVAPNARVSIEPGSGTAVFGDESELRRMFQVLVGSTSPASGASEMGTPELAVRREGSEVRVSVTLGPDSSANAGTERSWLARMAIRYGGRFELEGGTESILLPADGATNQREVEALRRELEAAQRQGEAYARELATSFIYESTPPPRFTSRPADAANAGLGTVASLAAAISATLHSIGEALEKELLPLRERAGGTAPEPLVRLGELVVDLDRLGQCPSYESAQHVNLADTVRAALAELEPRATRRGVALKSQVLPHANVGTRPVAAALLVRTLIADAIAATPRGGEVRVKLEPDETGYRVLVEDDGRPLSAEALHSLASAQADPSNKLGRPASGAMACAEMLARHIRIEVGVATDLREEGAPAGARVTLEFERA